ncbi:MAG: hypothetical protein WBX15_01075 [Thermoanaerobaculia bacterium]
MQIGATHPLFDAYQVLGGDLAPDGQRFLLLERSGSPDDRDLTVVTNWTEALKQASN